MNFSLRLFQLLVSLFAAFTLSSAWRDSHNSLERYPEWQSAKAELALGVNGARSFMLTPVTLAGRSLNLAAWHGHQELSLRNQWRDFPFVEFRVFAQGASELTLIARQPLTGKTHSLRLSNNLLRPSAWLELGKDREFQGKRALSASLPEGLWTNIVLREAGGRVEAMIDGKTAGTSDWPPGPWQISFRGNSSEGLLLLDDLKLSGHGSVYSQTFDGQFPFLLFSLVSLLLLGFLVMFELLVGDGAAFVASLVITLGCGFFQFSYSDKLSARYPITVDLSGYPSNVESGDEAIARLSALPAGQRPVLLWLGGSQAWGAGASAREKTVFGILQAELQPVIRSRFDLVNGAISGSQLSDQLKPFSIVAGKRKVAAVVLTTSVNDARSEEMSAFARELKQAGAQLFLVAEPTESPVTELVRKRQTELRLFAAAQSIAFFDLQQELDKFADDGFHWWDFVHLSDAGARRAATGLRPALETFLQALPQR